MEEFSLFPSDNFIQHLPVKTSTPCPAWEPTSFLPVYLINTHNASLWRRHRELSHIYDSNSWQLFLPHRRKTEWNCTSIAGSWQVQHRMSSPLGVPSTELLLVVFSSSGAHATQDMKGPNMGQSKGKCFILRITTHPAFQNTQVGSKPGKTHASNCLQICPLPWILRTHHSSGTKLWERKDVKNAFVMLTQHKLKNAF